MTALVGFVATVVCLTSLFCVVKLLVRYRSGEPLLPPLPENPASWDGFDVASLFVLFIVCQAMCVTVVQHFFPVGDEASADVLGYQLLANAIAMLVFTGVAAREVASDGVQVHGAYGLSKQYTVERIYRESKFNEVVLETSELQRVIAANALMRD